MVEEIYRSRDSIKSPDGERIFLNCFKNAEQTFGRKDAKTFEGIISDLIEDRLPLEALIDPEELELMLKSKYYSGFSLSPSVDAMVKQAFEDEYNLSVQQIEDLQA